MKAERVKEAIEERFEAGRGWSLRFKKRSYLYNIKLPAEAASDDIEASASFPENLAKIIHVGDYST